MDQNNTPDSWDTNMDANSGGTDSVEDVSNALTALNVNAMPFVPGQNVFAREFVPVPDQMTDETDKKDGEPYCVIFRY